MTDIKNEIAKIMNNAHWQLEDLEAELRKKINELDESDLQEKQFIFDNRISWFKKIVHYMLNGLTYWESIQLIADDEGLNDLRLKRILATGRNNKKIELLFAKSYTASTLKKAGFSNIKIAEIMKISAATVARLLNYATGKKLFT